MKLTHSTTEQGLFAAADGARPGASAAQRVYANLRQRIVNLELKPDSTLSRNALAKHYNVSQTPIREAMQKLEQDGLVRIFPQSGTVVARIDVKQLHETQFLRVAVEIEVVRRLATDPDAPTLHRARVLLDMQEALRDRPEQVDMFSDLDKAFHRTLFAGVGMIGLHHYLEGRLGHLARCQRLELPKAGRMVGILGGHTAVLDAIEAGDADGAAQQMRNHLTGTILRISVLQEEFPDYFTAEQL
ncbi:GntR family transcriptional regulator [Primorskyibacter flagellatus]|uniref:Transcriptional regulator, GntR family n=1 Tax=Primorskyibacter flagellatus TaxID=1387277 RepID=A0A1W2DR44_9RHOB|nr:GntR family transcriptional regulator [Primorskyibacter flagellatus]SMC99914.1 transcriptional regulator, GntR family [Primorskyibacter flagellatus]